MADPLSADALIAALGKDWGDSVVDALVKALSGSSELERMEQLAFYVCPDRGVSIALKDKLYIATSGAQYTTDGPITVIGIHLHSPGYEGFQGFGRPLPQELSFDDRRDDVRAKLGMPTASGGGNEALGRVWPHWDRFDSPTHSLRIQYSPDQNRTDIVTLIASSEVRG